MQMEYKAHRYYLTDAEAYDLVWGRYENFLACDDSTDSDCSETHYDEYHSNPPFPADDKDAEKEHTPSTDIPESDDDEPLNEPEKPDRVETGIIDTELTENFITLSSRHQVVKKVNFVHGHRVDAGVNVVDIATPDVVNSNEVYIPWYKGKNTTYADLAQATFVITQVPETTTMTDLSIIAIRGQNGYKMNLIDVPPIRAEFSPVPNPFQYTVSLQNFYTQENFDNLQYGYQKGLLYFFTDDADADQEKYARFRIDNLKTIVPVNNFRQVEISLVDALGANPQYTNASDLQGPVVLNSEDHLDLVSGSNYIEIEVYFPWTCIHNSIVIDMQGNLRTYLADAQEEKLPRIHFTGETSVFPQLIYHQTGTPKNATDIKGYRELSGLLPPRSFTSTPIGPAHITRFGEPVTINGQQLLRLRVGFERPNGTQGEVTGFSYSIYDK